MTNLLERAINNDDSDHAAKLPQDREQRARTIGDWLKAEVRYLA